MNEYFDIGYLNNMNLIINEKW